jgi:hypothetical protein
MDVNQVNDFGKTPLMTAAQFGLADSAGYLLTHGADVNAVIPAKAPLQAVHRTALHYAAASRSLPMIRLLVTHGADIHAKDSAGENADYFFGSKDAVGQHTPLDYFEGNGPVEKSNSLSDEDKAEAMHLLGG